MVRFGKPRGLKEQALELNEAGYRVFPVGITPPGDGGRKAPLIRGYHGQEPFTEREIERWPWERAKHLGWALPKGDVVLDVDIKAGKQGEEHLRRLEDAHGRLPETAEQETPSGGRHLLFRLPPEAAPLRGRVQLPDGSAADIDICHTGNRYMTIYDPGIFDRPVADLPASWLPSLVASSPRSTSLRHGDPRTTQLETEPHNAGESLDQLAQAEQGTRNNTLNKIVHSLALRDDWNEAAQDETVRLARGVGLTQSEIDATIASATSAAARRRGQPVWWFETSSRTARCWVVATASTS